MGLVFKYGSEKAVIPVLNPQQGDGLEFWITNKIREIRDKADDIKHRIGVITEKDELKLSDQNLVPEAGSRQGSPSMQSIIEQAFPFYKVEEVKLSESEPIDKGFVGLVITQPRKDYTDKELRRIDEFLMHGKQVARRLRLGRHAEAARSEHERGAQHCTISTSCSSGYGIQMNKDAVFDYGAQFRIGVMTQGGMAVIRHPGIAHVVERSRASTRKRSRSIRRSRRSSAWMRWSSRSRRASSSCPTSSRRT